MQRRLQPRICAVVCTTILGSPLSSAGVAPLQTVMKKVMTLLITPLTRTQGQVLRERGADTTCCTALTTVRPELTVRPAVF